eukprot:TRINITY_DN306_c1_g1_i1.p1 TRINITY_DN306_c1_g1~~TRINITY_DN306_c1_g1_i1.p1  ORF type:complete len:278 (-),score=83.34 TRINITY_DN306_c1_g1_i1:32-865(-)
MAMTASTVVPTPRNTNTHPTTVDVGPDTDFLQSTTATANTTLNEVQTRLEHILLNAVTPSTPLPAQTTPTIFARYNRTPPNELSLDGISSRILTPPTTTQPPVQRTPFTSQHTPTTHQPTPPVQTTTTTEPTPTLQSVKMWVQEFLATPPHPPLLAQQQRTTVTHHNTRSGTSSASPTTSSLPTANARHQLPRHHNVPQQQPLSHHNDNTQHNAVDEERRAVEFYARQVSTLRQQLTQSEALLTHHLAAYNEQRQQQQRQQRQQHQHQQTRPHRHTS